MANSKILVPFLISWEGGFANDPADLGGATNKGVTLNTFRAYRKKKGLPTPGIPELKKLSDEEWGDIWESMFWNKIRGSEIKGQNVANIFGDWLWMSGGNAIKGVQRVLGVKVDGDFGPKSLSALNSAPEEELFNKIKAARKDYYNSIVKARPLNKKFLNGWLRRLSCLKFGTLISGNGKIVWKDSQQN